MPRAPPVTSATESFMLSMPLPPMRFAYTNIVTALKERRMGNESRMAVVTGAGSGLGRAIALRLASEGAAVAAIDIDPAAAKETAGMIKAAGGRSLGLRADVSRADELDAAVTAAVA